MIIVLDFSIGFHPSQIALKNIMLCDFLFTIPGVRQSIHYYLHFQDDKIEFGSQGTIWLIQFG